MSALREQVLQMQKEIADLKNDISHKEQTLADAKAQDIYQSKEIARLHVQITEQGKALKQQAEDLARSKAENERLRKTLQTVHRAAVSLSDMILDGLSVNSAQVSQILHV